MAATATLLGFLKDSKSRNNFGLPSIRDEEEIIILGDLNDSAFRKKNFNYMFDYMEGSGYVHAKPEIGNYPRTRTNGSQIDHIFVSDNIQDNNYIEGSFKIHHIEGTSHKQFRKNYSDHYPVTIDVLITTEEE